MTTPQRLAWLFLVLAVAPAIGRADKKDDARVHVANATRAHKAGQYDEARLELEAAYALDPDPAVLYALGQVHAKLGHCRESTAYFKRFAATQTDPQVIQIVDQAIAACSPPAAPASRATAPTAPASQPSAAAPPVATTASAPGASTASVSGANAATAPGASAAAARANTASTAGAPAAAPPPSAWYRDKLGDGLVIGGIVAATIGLLEYRGALSDLNAAENRSTTTTLARYDDLLASAHDKRTASVVLFGASAALVAGGITRFILRDRGGEVRSVSVAPARRGAVRSVSVAPARGGAVISVGGSL